ncbi:MAG TPA: DUF2232 domain-containing protein [Deltaproteobacteria bacterium]|nr:DUF2232 domain-containing protein [Deltaproteobacteria bacterium]HPP80797.1 DUF2232 domain-containing protein [Deltaproteobacteria bacterium]
MIGRVRGGGAEFAATALYLLYGCLVVALPALTIPLALFCPSLWCILASGTSTRRAFLAGAAPLALAVLPWAGQGAAVYALFYVAAMLMHSSMNRSMTALAVIAPTVLAASVIASAMLVSAHAEGASLGDVVSRWVQEVMKGSRDAADAMLYGAELEEFKAMLETARSRIVTLFPGLVLTGCAFVFWVNLVIANAKTHRVGLRTYRVPDALIACFIAAGTLSVLPWEKLSAVGLNLLLVVGFVYFLQGLAIASVFMDSRGWPAFIRSAIYILIFIQIYMVIVVAAVGLFDAWFDFRARITTRKGEYT